MRGLRPEMFEAEGDLDRVRVGLQFFGHVGLPPVQGFPQTACNLSETQHSTNNTVGNLFLPINGSARTLITGNRPKLAEQCFQDQLVHG